MLWLVDVPVYHPPNLYFLEGQLNKTTVHNLYSDELVQFTLNASTEQLHTRYPDAANTSKWCRNELEFNCHYGDSSNENKISFSYNSGSNSKSPQPPLFSQLPQLYEQILSSSCIERYTTLLQHAVEKLINTNELAKVRSERGCGVL